MNIPTLKLFVTMVFTRLSFCFVYPTFFVFHLCVGFAWLFVCLCAVSEALEQTTWKLMLILRWISVKKWNFRSLLFPHQHKAHWKEHFQKKNHSVIIFSDFISSRRHGKYSVKLWIWFCFNSIGNHGGGGKAIHINVFCAATTNHHPKKKNRNRKYTWELVFRMFCLFRL